MATAGFVDGVSNSKRHVRPPIVTFRPSMWGDIFSVFTYDDQVQQKYIEEIEAIKSGARSLLMAATSTKLIMILIDTLECLGLAYHFESEIELKLKQVYDSLKVDEDFDLFTTTLRFRLLRQYQYDVSCDVFNKFVDENNKFKETLIDDTEGLLSLYEAAHLGIRDEKVLEQALEFTRQQLTRMLPQLKSPLKEKVQHALKNPLHRSVAIIEIRFYISIYGKDESRDELLLKLAKFNFNFLQNIYKNEILQLSRWWNKFDLKSKLPYARDRLVECYLWGMGHHFEPKYSYVRKSAAIHYQLITTLDDTYDNYATVEEAQLFTQALERWNMDQIDLLPDYMKIVYKFVMNIYEDFEREAEKQDKSFAVPYYREAVKLVGRGYNEELKWIMGGEMPSFEEYMTNSVIRSCMPMTLAAVVPGCTTATKETLDWLLSEPKILISASKIVRLLDDLATHERENREGKLLTIVDCYMKDKGVSKQEALAKFAQIVEDEWGNANEEWVKETCLPKEFLVQFLNFARAAEVTYKDYEDGYSCPETNLAAPIIALLVDPILI